MKSFWRNFGQPFLGFIAFILICVPIYFVIQNTRDAGDPCSRGDRLVIQEKYDEAEKSYRDALQKNPQEYCARLGLGALYRKTGKLTAAVPELEAAVSGYEKLGDPGTGFSVRAGWFSACFDLANCYYQLEQYQKCIEICSKILSRKKDEDIWFLRASAYAMTHQLSKSESDLNELIEYAAKIEQKPQEKFFHKRANVRMDMGRFTEALADLNQAEKLDSSCATIMKDRDSIRKSQKP